MSPEPPTPKHHVGEQVRQKSLPRPVNRTKAPEAMKMLQLIEAAEDIFLAKGYYAATMNDVAKAAGMSKRTVYQLIESKAGLFSALLGYRQEKLFIPEIREDWSAHEILVQNLLCLARFLFSPQQIAIIRLIMAEYTHCKELGRLFHQNRVVKARMLLEKCLKKIDPPLYGRPDKSLCDVGEMAAVLFGMALDGFLVGVLIGFRPMPTKAELTRRVDLAVNMFLRSCEAENKS
jgi:TetR/AcrR family transcriptional regulator, mexJK operon transcriptional repressor